MKPLKVLHRGFDNLDVSFTAMLTPAGLEAMEAARQQAEQNMRPTPLRLGPGLFDIDIAEKGARNGYRYLGDTGPMGATWIFKRRPVPEPGNIRASAKSLPLAVDGYEATKARFSAALQAMGATVMAESVARIDFAVDFLMPPDFQLNPDQFVSHARTTTRENNVAPQSVHEADAIGIVAWSGRRCTGVTIGKNPWREVVVYDKRREVIAKHKSEPWATIWGMANLDGLNIWRIEIRLFKRYLAEKLKVFSYSEVEGIIRQELHTALDAVRYLARSAPSGNVTREPDHAMWQAAREQVSNALDAPTSMITRAALTDMQRNIALDRRRRMVSSLMPGILAMEGYDAKEASQIAATVAADIVTASTTADPTHFERKFMSAAEEVRHLMPCPRTSED